MIDKKKRKERPCQEQKRRRGKRVSWRTLGLSRLKERDIQRLHGLLRRTLVYDPPT